MKAEHSSRRFLRPPTIRRSIALEAARLLYRRDYKEYYQAKREAARRHGSKVLPTNQEIHHLILRIADESEGQNRTKRLREMRLVAQEMMRLLASFRPRLVGSVLTGHIRQGSDIDLHLYAEQVGAITKIFERQKLPHEVSRVQSRANGREQEFVHLRHVHTSGFEVEMTLYEPGDYDHHPTCSITGGPMARATLGELQHLLSQAGPEPSEQESPELESRRFQALLEAERPLPELCRLIPELAACRGVVQNLQHHLDVFEHTGAVVEELRRLAADDFQEFSSQTQLIAHYRSGLWSGWKRWNLLLLSALLHDIGKPATTSSSAKGRIRFLNHQSVGAKMARTIAARLRLPDAVGGALELMVEHHRTSVLMPEKSFHPSRVYRFFQEVGTFAPDLLLLSLADVRSARRQAMHALRLEEQRLFVGEMLEEYFGLGEMKSPVIPVSIIDLETELGLSCPQQRDTLHERLIEGYLDGEFVGREDGLSRAAELLQTSSDLW